MDRLIVIADALRQPIQRLADRVLDVSKIQDCVRNSLGLGSFKILEALAEFRILLEALEIQTQVDVRLEVAFNSLGKLFLLIEGGAEGDIAPYLLAEIVAKLKADFREIYLGTENMEVLLTSLIVALVQYPFVIAGQMFEATRNGKLWCFANLPKGMRPGVINSWLNDYSTYGGDTDDKLAIEREFRSQFIASLDAYFRDRGELKTELGIELPINRSDERLSTEVLSDLVSLVVDVTITFILEPECLPRVEADVDHFEDIGFRMRRSMSRSLRASVKATVGTNLRGIWIWEVGNENLIETLGVLLGSVLSATLEGMIGHLGWSLEIVSTYPGADIGTAFVVHRWKSGEFVGTSTNEDRRVEYLAFVRSHRTDLSDAQKAKLAEFTRDWNQPNSQHNAQIRGIIEDFGAYLDVSYRQFRISSRFVDSRKEDAVSILAAEIRGSKLVVEATTTRALEKPAPVLRVFLSCRSYVMAPGSTPQDPYTLELDADKVSREREITVLSSRGGSKTFPILR